MENLSINEAPSQGGGGVPPALGRAPPQQQQQQQLPAQMFTTAAQLLDLTDSMPASPQPCLLLGSAH